MTRYLKGFVKIYDQLSVELELLAHRNLTKSPHWRVRSKRVLDAVRSQPFLVSPESANGGA